MSIGQCRRAAVILGRAVNITSFVKYHAIIGIQDQSTLPPLPMSTTLVHSTEIKLEIK